MAVAPLAPAMLDSSEMLSALSFTVNSRRCSRAPLTSLLLRLGLQAQSERSADDLMMMQVHSVTEVRFTVRGELI